PKIQKGINPKLDLDRHGQHITHTHPGQFSMKIPGQFSAQLNTLFSFVLLGLTGWNVNGTKRH
ncbi:hypothetical protein, partial [Novosphingobium umbonatum]|uniref:hypothetical protein n=1 Tax=Novosphingobium umbonatum TaxID=1908524 RepID=UPI001C701EE5